MANALNIELKAAKVAEIKEKLEKAQSVIVFDYRGLTVEEDTQLRVNMRKENVEYLVLKNGIVSRACEAAGISEEVNSMLKGPSAFAFGYEDAVVPARILKDFVKKTKKCEIKGGVVGESIFSAAQVEQLADLPPKEVLLARLLGSMMSPIANFAVVLDQIRQAKEGGAGEAAPEAAAE